MLENVVKSPPGVWRPARKKKRDEIEENRVEFESGQKEEKVEKDGEGGGVKSKVLLTITRNARLETE